MSWNALPAAAGDLVRSEMFNEVVEAISERALVAYWRWDNIRKYFVYDITRVKVSGQWRYYKSVTPLGFSNLNKNPLTERLFWSDITTDVIPNAVNKDELLTWARIEDLQTAIENLISQFYTYIYDLRVCKKADIFENALGPGITDWLVYEPVMCSAVFNDMRLVLNELGGKWGMIRHSHDLSQGSYRGMTETLDNWTRTRPPYDTIWPQMIANVYADLSYRSSSHPYVGHSGYIDEGNVFLYYSGSYEVKFYTKSLVDITIDSLAFSFNLLRFWRDSSVVQRDAVSIDLTLNGSTYGTKSLNADEGAWPGVWTIETISSAALNLDGHSSLLSSATNSMSYNNWQRPVSYEWPSWTWSASMIHVATLLVKASFAYE